ncbi:MAG: hypothetical protein D6719_03170 [Candidatus Dadabacteria bacterium]|nr:MAG: hypothetical protein D6719_03170 [Candidatus Dadabacteria bacterium]
MFNEVIKRTGSENGIILPVTAILVLIVMTFVLGLGVDSSTIHRAKVALNLKAEEMCQAVLPYAELQAEAARVFSRQVNATVQNKSLEADGVTLLGAKLAISTMPADGCFDFPGSGCNTPPLLEGVGDNPGMTNGPFFFSTGNNLGIPSCNFDCNGLTGCTPDCVFQGQLEGDPDYPNGLFTELRNSGNTVACKLKGSITTILRGQKIIEAHTVWKKNVRGECSGGTCSPANANNPGLIIAIAPQMTTFANDKRFWFMSDSDYSEQGLTQTVRERVDPLFYFNRGTAPGLRAFSGASDGTQITYPLGAIPGAFKLQIPAPIDADCSRDFDPNTPGCQLLDQNGNIVDYDGGINHTWYNPVAGGTFPRNGFEDAGAHSDREEMLAACMNPLILMRNLFLARIIELASRNAELRNMTSIYMVTSQNRTRGRLAGGVVGRSLNSRDGPLKLNQPVELLSFGQDLTEPIMQLPYVFFDTGIWGWLPKEYGPPKYGWVNPFNLKDTGFNAQDATVQRAMQQYHVLVANQLRYCYHLWDASNGLTRPYLPGLFDENGNRKNQGSAGELFEPDPPYSFNPSLTSNSYFAGDSWDQECPWGTGGVPSCSPSDSRGLTAAELVSIMGSVQLCPYEMAGLPGQYTGAADEPDLSGKLDKTSYDPATVDSDGDGTVDADDPCPGDAAIAPPSGGALMPDSDGDGVVDACDMKPARDNGPRGPAGDAADSDGDGFSDWPGLDNCIAVSNPNQNDTDGDGFGDLCDSDIEKYWRGICRKPDVPTDTTPLVRYNLDLLVSYDLRPDLVGLLCHLAGNKPTNGVCDAFNARQFRSVSSPGLYPLKTPPVSPLNPLGDPEPFVADAYNDTATNTDATILIVTHRGIAERESNDLHDLVTSPAFRNRQIIVVWMPEFAYGTDDAAKYEYIYSVQINRFKWAFDVSYYVSPSDPKANSFFAFSPYLDKYQVSGTSPALFNTGDSSDKHQKFWHYMIGYGGPGTENISIAATNIYNERILSKTLHY